MALYSKLHELLLEGGLTEVESLIYIELLKKPATTLWELVGRTGINKTGVYRACDRLRELGMMEKTEQGFRALSVKNLVAELEKQERKAGKLADKIRTVAPFLRAPKNIADESDMEEFESFYDIASIRDAYISMSNLNYSVNLDFGDFENFISAVGNIELAHKFRLNRVKHAGHHAICTTFGPLTSHFTTKEAEARFKNKINLLNINFKNRFVIFSDTSDYVFYGEAIDPEFPTAVILRSKVIADAERLRFATFSQKFGNS